MKFLFEWRKRVGASEANRISKLSAGRGTVMHKLIELFLETPFDMPYDERIAATMKGAKIDDEIIEVEENKDENQSPKRIGYNLFMNFMNNNSEFCGQIKNVVASETFLWTLKGGGYAGTVDNISRMKDGSLKIIDFKSSAKPKREDWIEDYKLQVAAYSIAAWDLLGERPTGAEIWISNEIEPTPQKFVMDVQDITEYFKKFRLRLNAFYEKYPR
jgi:genome maintenance exonuclease 1